MSRFVYRCAMRWSDMDAFAHVNNVVYLTYLEQARVAMFFDQYDSTFSAGTVIAGHRIEYHAPVTYSPQPLRIETWVGRVRAAAFEVHYEVFDDSTVAPPTVTSGRPVVTASTNACRRFSRSAAGTVSCSRCRHRT